MNNVLEALQLHKEEISAAAATPFLVFLCGPSLHNLELASARLRQRLSTSLSSANFEVVLGEDEGLENIRLSVGINAQDNELEFIRTNCNAVVIVADSPGSFCELGLFSWHFAHKGGLLYDNTPRTTVIVLIAEKFRNDKSYLNEGPGASVNGFGHLEFVDFENYDGNSVIKRLHDRRGVVTVDNKRGRPRHKKK